MDNVTNELLLENLKRIQGDLGDVKEGLTEIKSRLSGLEISTAGQRKETAALFVESAAHCSGHDRLLDRIRRIEKRLEIHDG